MQGDLERRDPRKGAILLLLSFVAIPLLAVLGLVLDGGNLYFERREAQAAADSAAWGGTKELIRGNADNVVAAGRADAKRMGFDNAVTDVVVSIHNPPQSGPRTGDSNYVEAIVERQAATTLLGMFEDAATARARAVAGIELDYGAPCVLSLDPEEAGSITVSGTAALDASDCDVISSSVSPNAITANGGGCLTAAYIGYPAGGGANANGQNCLNGNVGPVIPPGDPYAHLAEPGSADDPYIQAGNSYTVQATNRTTITGGTVNISPGIYRGGLKITGGVVNLAPGVYIVDGMEVSGGAEVNGCGVMIYNTASGGLKNISFGGSTTSRLSAMTSGPYQNILFFNSRVTLPNGGGTPYEMTIDGGTGSYWDGVIYAPTVHLDFVGNTETNLTGLNCGNGQAIFNQVVANTIRLTGTSSVNMDWAGSGRTPTTSRVSMVE